MALIHNNVLAALMPLCPQFFIIVYYLYNKGIAQFAFHMYDTFISFCFLEKTENKSEYVHDQSRNQTRIIKHYS